MDLRMLKRMKSDMAKRGNWKEVKRVNRMIEMNQGNYVPKARRGKFKVKMNEEEMPD